MTSPFRQPSTPWRVAQKEKVAEPQGLQVPVEGLAVHVVGVHHPLAVAQQPGDVLAVDAGVHVLAVLVLGGRGHEAHAALGQLAQAGSGAA